MTAPSLPRNHVKPPKRLALGRRSVRALRRCPRDESGFVLVFLALAIPAILGLIGLALDGIRLMSLDTELANLADTSALAAASRLDRSERAIPQAREAALALLNAAAPDRPRPAGAQLSFRFAENLADLLHSPTYSLADNAGAKAAYVEVRTAETSLTTSLLQLVGARPSPLRRQAIAELTFYACDVTPALLCVPRPGDFVARSHPGQQYLLRMDGNLIAGSIALLDRPDAVSDRQTLRNLASNAPQFCYADRVRLRTNISPAEFDAAVNIRFDRYVTPAGPARPRPRPFSAGAGRDPGTSPRDVQLAARREATSTRPTTSRATLAYEGIRLSGLWNQGVGDWKIAPAIGGTGVAFATALDEYLAWNHADKGPDILDRLREFGDPIRSLLGGARSDPSNRTHAGGHAQPRPLE